MKVRDKVYIEAVVDKKIETDKGIHYELLISQFDLVGRPRDAARVTIVEKFGPLIKV